MSTSPNTTNTRRSFLQTSSAGLAVGASTLASASPSVHITGSDTIRVGLIGAGGRGSSAAVQCCNADDNVKLVAIADIFEDRLLSKRQSLTEQLKGKADLPRERCFDGFDGYKQLLGCDIDLVILATPPHFRPLHLKAVVDAGKHAFVEKPVAVDGPGIRSVAASCDLAKKKGLSVVSGLCWRYHYAVRETVKRIHDGDIGDVLAIQTNYNTGTLWMKPRQESWSDMEWQLRNWLYFAWLSGDHNVEQHIHSLDKTAWVMHDTYPVSAVGLGGRQVRHQPEFGHIYDHHAVVYELANGVRIHSYCRQMDGCHMDVSDQVLGTKGSADILGFRVSGENKWRFRGKQNNMYQTEHDEMIAAIRAGKPIYNGDYMTKSSMMAIMGRMATYTGQKIKWDDAWNSSEDLTPPKYEFGDLPTPEVAMPGITKFA